MIDIKFIRENSELVRNGAKNKGVDIDMDRFLELDKKKREVIQALEDMRAQKNKTTKEIPQMKDKQEREKIILQMRELDINSDRLEDELKNLEAEFSEILMKIPNIPSDDVPVGKNDIENVEIRQVGKKTKFDFPFKDYLTLGEELDLIDVKRASKVSGTRFGYIKGGAAFLEFAIVQLVFETLAKEGFIPVVPPVMLKPEMAKGMGYLEQTDKEEAYFIPSDNLYLTGTSEQSLGAMHSDEVFDEKDLPRRYVGFSTCFRRESGSYGKDTKGILRVHQFDKIEMFSYCKKEDSQKEHDFLLSMEEKLMQLLEIPYRVLRICTGDLGCPAARKFDIEAWIPSENRYRETHSTSNCTDFQSRRLNIRYKTKDGLEFVHTLNGTAFAIGRILIAIIENYQQEDGSIKVPKVLEKYSGLKFIKK
jgi:seryl-tRNA synthetase